MLNIKSNPKAWFTCGDILGIFQKSVCWVIITSNLKEINNIISEKKKRFKSYLIEKKKRCWKYLNKHTKNCKTVWFGNCSTYVWIFGVVANKVYLFKKKVF